MRCHYEVLAVDSNCSSDDLKKAYRKLALEWHPDKNLDRLEEAKEAFQLIQQAYEVLADPQERAWYDRHRDEILQGDAEEAYKDDSLNVYHYFTTSCFKGYNDGEKGFYTVYRQVFEKLAAEDKPFKDDDEEVPNFGTSDSPYEDVHAFYAYWQSYCTAKSYSWLNQYGLTEARKSGVGRQVIRMMEKENKKLRDQQKKIRNEEVRELVAFVRKRDKRVQALKKLMEEMRAEKAKRAEELRRKQLEERNKALENYKECEWSSMSQFEEHFNEMENTLDGSNVVDNSEEVREEDLYCVACEKDFRSLKAMKNHENSKKHRENVAVLTALMLEEDRAENGIIEEKNDGSCEEVAVNSNSEEMATSDALLDELIKSSTKTKKKKKKNKVPSVDEEQKVSQDILEDLSEIDLKLEDTHISSTSEENVESRVKCIIEEDTDSNVKFTTVENIDSNVKCTTENSVPVSVPQKKKKKGKVPKDVSNATEQDEVEKPCTICGTCRQNFSSRNKLFEHLKESRHAVYKNENISAATDCKTSKKQRKKR